jgi:hypothetical protein
MKAGVKMLAVMLFTLSLPVSVLAGSGDHVNPGVVPPQSHVHGLTYAQWSVRWWQWLLAIPADQNPTFDTTGEDCAVGQSGHVWFLAGTPGGSATRTCTVPPGTSLFFPIVNAEMDYPCPDPTFQPAPGQSLEAFLTEEVRALVDLVSDVRLEVDGRAVTKLADFRVTSSLFYFTGDPSLTAVFDSCITGSSQPAVSDGYWVMLSPLSRGTHTIHFGGKFAPIGFETEATYTLIVE